MIDNYKIKISNFVTFVIIKVNVSKNRHVKKSLRLLGPT